MEEINDKEFIHFDTVEECEDFVQYLKTYDISITHKCCSNKGCGLIKNKFIEIKNIIKMYPKKMILNENLMNYQ
jgi:hypothetical protein